MKTSFLMRSQSGLGISLLKVYEMDQRPSFVTFLEPTNKKNTYLEADFNMGRVCKYSPPYSFSAKIFKSFCLGRTQHFKDSPSEHCPTSPFTMDTKYRKI